MVVRLQMAAVLLSMLRQLAEAPPGMHSVADESIAWGAACAVFASAAADVSVPAQQQALLQLTAQVCVSGDDRIGQPLRQLSIKESDNQKISQFGMLGVFSI